MEEFKDNIRYGFKLYPFALMILAGLFISNAGPAILSSLTSGMQGVAFYSIFMFIGIILIQAAGGITAVAGFFGALHKVLEDAE